MRQTQPPPPTSGATRAGEASAPPSPRRAGLWPSAVALVAAASLVAGGVTLIRARAATAPELSPAPLPLVETVALRRESGYPVRSHHAARAEPARRVTLAFESGGTLLEVTRDEGEEAAAGAVVARLDTRLLDAERRAAAATRAALAADVELARLALERQRSLERRAFAAPETLDAARLGLDRASARLAEADAALARLAVAHDKSVLRAPFDAVVATRALDPGATVQPGTPVLELLDAGTPRLRVGVAPERAATLVPDGVYRFRSDTRGAAPTDTAPTIAARLLRARDDIDAATRTRTLLFEPLPGEPRPAPGALLELTLEERVAREVYALPIAALAADARGNWTVLAAIEDGDEEARLALLAVELVHVAGDRAWIAAPGGSRGERRPAPVLADALAVVTGGRHRAVAGERVRVLRRESRDLGAEPHAPLPTARERRADAEGIAR